MKIDDVLEKDFNIHLKKHNEVRHTFKLEYNITEIKFYLYLYNNEIYNDDKMEYLKKILFNNKKLNLIFFLLYRCMNYYRKLIEKTVNDIKLKMQICALTLKLSENNDKIDDLIEVDKNIKNDILSNTTKIGANETNILYNLEKINSMEENNFKISNDVFNDKYDIKNQLFSFNKNVHSYKLFEKTILKDNFNGELVITNIITYKYDNLQNDINRLTHMNQFYNDKNALYYAINLDNHNFGISNFEENISIVRDNLCLNLNNNNKIKIILSLTIANSLGYGIIKCNMIDDNSINIIYTEQIPISKKFDENDKKTDVLDSQLLELKEKISDNNNLIGNNFTSILPLKSNYIIDSIWLYNLDFKDINFTSDINKFLVYENNIVYNFKINLIIELNESHVYLYDSLKHYYYVLKEHYTFLDQNDTLIEEFSFNMMGKGVVYRNLQIYNNKYYFKIISNITNLNIRLYLERINIENDMEFNLKLTNEFQNNQIILKYFKYTS